nr:nuclear transport factor 2 family protein [Sphingomonas sp. Y57]
MNEAEKLLRAVFRFGDGNEWDAIATIDRSRSDSWEHIHPDARYSLFGPSGTKEMLVGRDAFLDFVTRCAAAISERHDEIVTISGIDEQCALVHARAYRRSRATGEEIRYEWAMLYRVEDGRITYGADMLDADAQAFWGRVLG